MKKIKKRCLRCGGEIIKVKIRNSGWSGSEGTREYCQNCCMQFPERIKTNKTLWIL